VRSSRETLVKAMAEEPEKVSDDVENTTVGMPVEDEFAHGSRLVVIMVSLLIGMFVVRPERPNRGRNMC
jgi:hypothetical protein